MKTVVTTRKPTGSVDHRCANPDCNKLFVVGMRSKMTALTFVHTYTNKGQWRRVEVYHPECYKP